MKQVANHIAKLLNEDPRYRLEAYQFVREALSFAQDVMSLDNVEEDTHRVEADPQGDSTRHLTGQQLCEAIRQYAIEQYGYMTPVVLKNWGVTSTSDFGEIVYNLIKVKMMKKSQSDQREDFNDVYDFDVAFREQFKIDPVDT